MCVEKVWQFSTLSVPAAHYPKHITNGRKDVRWQARKQQCKQADVEHAKAEMGPKIKKQ